MDIISKELLETSNQDTALEGIVFVRYFKKMVSPKGTNYLTGEIEFQNKYGLTMWSNCNEYKQLETIDVHNSLAFIKGTVNIFNNKKGIVLSHFELIQNNGIDLEQFKSQKYNKQVFEKSFLDLMSKHVSRNGYNLFLNIMEINIPNGIWERFTMEYAAKTNHDNCDNGLLAHTYKCLRLLEYLERPYGFIGKLKTNEMNEKEIADLLYIGTALHDIGKIYELKEGLYQPESFNTHRILGLEVIFKHKEEILKIYNEHWYQALVSIIVGHHDKYGEEAKTLYAYIVFMIDHMEYTFTGLDQILTNNITQDIEGLKILWNEKQLGL